MLSVAPALALALAAVPCDDARHQYEALAPEAALELAEAALARDAGRPLECLEIRALSLLVMGRREEARAAFGELFERDPTRTIDDPSLSPPLAALIAAARESARPLIATVRAAWGSALALRVETSLEGGLRGARAVRWRIAGTPGALAAAGTTGLVARVATTTLAVGLGLDVATVEVRGVVVDESGEILHRFERAVLLGPRPAPVAEIDREPGLAWWWWATLAAGVVAAATVSAVVLAQPELPGTAGTIGRVDVSP